MAGSSPRPRRRSPGPALSRVLSAAGESHTLPEHGPARLRGPPLSPALGSE